MPGDIGTEGIPQKARIKVIKLFDATRVSNEQKKLDEPTSTPEGTEHRDNPQQVHDSNLKHLNLVKGLLPNSPKFSNFEQKLVTLVNTLETHKNNISGEEYKKCMDDFFDYFYSIKFMDSDDLSTIHQKAPENLKGQIGGWINKQQSLENLMKNYSKYIDELKHFPPEEHDFANILTLHQEKQKDLFNEYKTGDLSTRSKLYKSVRYPEFASKLDQEQLENIVSKLNELPTDNSNITKFKESLQHKLEQRQLNELKNILGPVYPEKEKIVRVGDPIEFLDTLKETLNTSFNDYQKGNLSHSDYKEIKNYYHREIDAHIEGPIQQHLADNPQSRKQLYDAINPTESTNPYINKLKGIKDLPDYVDISEAVGEGDSIKYRVLNLEGIQKYMSDDLTSCQLKRGLDVVNQYHKFLQDLLLTHPEIDNAIQKQIEGVHLYNTIDNTTQHDYFYQSAKEFNTKIKTIFSNIATLGNQEIIASANELHEQIITNPDAKLNERKILREKALQKLEKYDEYIREVGGFLQGFEMSNELLKKWNDTITNEYKIYNTQQKGLNHFLSSITNITNDLQREYTQSMKKDDPKKLYDMHEKLKDTKNNPFLDMLKGHIEKSCNALVEVHGTQHTKTQQDLKDIYSFLNKLKDTKSDAENATFVGLLCNIQTDLPGIFNEYHGKAVSKEKWAAYEQYNGAVKTCKEDLKTTLTTYLNKFQDKDLMEIKDDVNKLCQLYNEMNKNKDKDKYHEDLAKEVGGCMDKIIDKSAKIHDVFDKNLKNLFIDMFIDIAKPDEFKPDAIRTLAEKIKIHGDPADITENDIKTLENNIIAIFSARTLISDGFKEYNNNLDPQRKSGLFQAACKSCEDYKTIMNGISGNLKNYIIVKDLKPETPPNSGDHLLDPKVLTSDISDKNLNKDYEKFRTDYRNARDDIDKRKTGIKNVPNDILDRDGHVGKLQGKLDKLEVLLKNFSEYHLREFHGKCPDGTFKKEDLEKLLIEWKKTNGEITENNKEWKKLDDECKKAKKIYDKIKDTDVKNYVNDLLKANQAAQKEIAKLQADNAKLQQRLDEAVNMLTEKMDEIRKDPRRSRKQRRAHANQAMRHFLKNKWTKRAIKMAGALGLVTGSIGLIPYTGGISLFGGITIGTMWYCMERNDRKDKAKNRSKQNHEKFEEYVATEKPA